MLGGQDRLNAMVGTLLGVPILLDNGESRCFCQSDSSTDGNGSLVKRRMQRQKSASSVLVFLCRDLQRWLEVKDVAGVSASSLY